MEPSTSPQSYQVDFEPAGKRISLLPGASLMDAALYCGLDLVLSCNGLGVCASCKIQLISGSLTALTPAEENKLSPQEIEAGIRLACQVRPLGDVRVYVPPSSTIHGQQLQIEGTQQSFIFDPPVKALDIAVPPAGPHDTDSDWERLQKACAAQAQELSSLALPVLQALPEALCANRGSVRVIFRGQALIGILPAQTAFLGLALDIGSTKVASYWVDLQSGAILLQAGFINPQLPFGEDVVNRIAYANQGPSYRQKLQTVLVAAINEHIADVCAQHSLERNQIVDMVVVGNSAIQHLLCGIPLRSLGEAPYTPVSKEALDFPAGSLGIEIAPGANVFIPPLIAGYVGADHTAAIIASRFSEYQETACLVDVGTNTEISLIHAGKMYACSCASGPAFEGAHIHDGMRAAAGAIDQVWIEDGKIRVSTILQRKPAGICGSGILSVVAELRRNRIIDRRGVFDKTHPLTQEQGRQKFVVLAEREEKGVKHAIRVTREDINEIQLAKGAIRTGIEILCRQAGIQAAQIQHFLIAGAFGNHLHLDSAIETGMLPDVPIARFRQIGNAAGVGAREILANRGLRELSRQVVSEIDYIELTNQPLFKDLFISALAVERSDFISLQV